MNLNYSRKKVKGITLLANLTWMNGVSYYLLDESIAVEDRNILPLAIRSTLQFDSNIKGLSASTIIDYLDASANVLFSRQMILQFPSNISEKIEILDYERIHLSGVTHFRVRADARLESGSTVMTAFEFFIINDIYYIPIRYP